MTTMSKAAALKIARAEIGPLYSYGRGQYGFDIFSAVHDCWMMGNSQPYAAARRSRADAIAMRALLAQGVDYYSAYRSIYA